MLSQWHDQTAAGFEGLLEQRVYTSRLLGSEPSLVLHGGGNTSVKCLERNLFGEEEEILWVKGSGWDLATISAGGFAPVRLQVLQRLAQLPRLSDTDMMRELKVACINPSAPTPSVEAILHAIIPLRFVDHTHADAVVAISNTPNGEALLRELYGDEVLILPYVMPGFILARQVFEATRSIDWSRLKGIILLHHGVFTFHDDARTSYENMVSLVDHAESFLREKGVLTKSATAGYSPSVSDLQQCARLRKAASVLAGRPLLLQWDTSPSAVGYAAMEGVASMATRGPVTPDHTLHTKHIPMIVDDDGDVAVNAYAEAYRHYFERNAHTGLTCLDPAPRVGIWLGKGLLALAPNAKRLGIVRDIARHTLRAVQWGEGLGGWCALPEQDLFELEYWELEQAKLKVGAATPAFEGKVAVVTGASSGIGKACVNALVQQGAAVAALDINPDVVRQFQSAQVLGLQCDVTDPAAVAAAVASTVMTFGGIDMVISNAGCFPPSATVASVATEVVGRSLSLNFTSHLELLQACLPFLQLGCQPAVVIVASKNVPAPGPGAVAYSAAKAALTQLARVAALEWGEYGIRVNVVHPNAVFDTAIWDEATLKARAESYGLTVEAYKTNNVLRREVRSSEVATAVVSLCGEAFVCTTGAQVPVDGGNDRVI